MPASTMPAETTAATPTTDNTDETPSWRDRALATTSAQARALYASAQSETRSVLYRHRRSLAPWKLAAGTAACGTAGAALAETPELPLLAASGGTGLAALTAGMITWRKVAKSVSAEMRSRLQTGLAAGCAWCATLPLTGADQLGMWVAFGLGTVGLSARWWKRLRPGYPTEPQTYVPDGPVETPPVDDSEQDMAEPGFAERVVELFQTHVAGATGVLAGAEIFPGQPTQVGWAFPISLTGHKHDLATARGAVARIGGAIGVFPDKITFEQCDEAPNLIEMRITQKSPHAGGNYQGPRIVTEGDDVFIELGPYADGEGYERFHVGTFNDELNDGSMNSGFVLGSKGSGKSKVLELIAIALRTLGIEIWYLDPQEGASSAALKNHADWPLMGVGTQGDPVGNARKLLRAVRRVAAIRQKEHAAWEWTGFTHHPTRPAIMVIVDECHKVFNEVNPESGLTFGVEFGELDRVARKLGIGILGASQIYTMETFGNSAALRSGMVAGNLLIMRMLEKSHFGLLPGSAPAPDQIPRGGGYGYSLEGARPQVLWRAEYCQDPAGWLAELPNASLDARAAKAIGTDYRDRFEQARSNAAAAAAALEAFDAATDSDTAPTLLQQQATPTSASTTADHSDDGGNRVPKPPSADVPDTVPTRELTARQQELVDLLTEHGQLHTDDIADHLGISVQAVRGIIRQLGETRLSQGGKKGMYRLA